MYRAHNMRHPTRASGCLGWSTLSLPTRHRGMRGQKGGSNPIRWEGKRAKEEKGRPRSSADQALLHPHCYYQGLVKRVGSGRTRDITTYIDHKEAHTVAQVLRPSSSPEVVAAIYSSTAGRETQAGGGRSCHEDEPLSCQTQLLQSRPCHHESCCVHQGGSHHVVQDLDRLCCG